MKPCILIVLAHSGCAISRQQNCPHRGRVGVAGVPLVEDTGSVSLVREYVSHYRKTKDLEYKCISSQLSNKS